MEKDILNPGQFGQVEVPNFLFDKIKNKIEQEERKASFQSKLLLAAAIITLFVNIGIVGQQKLQSNTSSATEYNPYSSLNYSLYE